MRVALLTREYPPEVYGGAGVHVEYLARELASRVDLTVHCWGADRADPAVHAYRPWEALAGGEPHLAALQAMSIDLLMAAGVEGAEIVHSHTWYAQFGGHLAKLTYGIPHVATVHSLEPLRPWKAEQLGGGYALSSFCERVALEGADAVIAVSEGSKRDILALLSGDRPRAGCRSSTTGSTPPSTRPTPTPTCWSASAWIRIAPSVVFVGRITRQKGVPHLLRAAVDFDPAAQLVLCAGAPDTPEIGAEVAAGVGACRRAATGSSGSTRCSPRLTSSSCSATPPSSPARRSTSRWESSTWRRWRARRPSWPRRRAASSRWSRTVRPGSWSRWNRRPARSTRSTPRASPAPSRERVNTLIADPRAGPEMGRAGRRRVIEHFAWPAIAEQTQAVYRRLTDRPGTPAPASPAPAPATPRP